jgi:hypothetical protein
MQPVQIAAEDNSYGTCGLFGPPMANDFCRERSTIPTALIVGYLVGDYCTLVLVAAIVSLGVLDVGVFHFFNLRVCPGFLRGGGG